MDRCLIRRGCNLSYVTSLWIPSWMKLRNFRQIQSGKRLCKSFFQRLYATCFLFNSHPTSPFPSVPQSFSIRRKLEFILAITFSIKMKIKHFYVGIPVHEYCLLKCVSFTAAEHSMVRYIWLLNFDSTDNRIKMGAGGGCRSMWKGTNRETRNCGNAPEV
jgi:hypothetical protein